MKKTKTLAFLLSMMATITFALPAKAQVREAYVARSTDGQTITFYYDNQKAARSSEGSVWGIQETKGEAGNYSPTWSGTYDNPEQTLLKAVFDASFRDYRPTNTGQWFRYCARLHIIEGLENLNTENVTDMYGMFYGCKALAKLDLSTFNTGKVTNMGEMFYGCEALAKLDLSTFNTAKVTNMYAMFDGCTALTTLGLSTFNTENVTDMRGMFAYCKALAKIDLSTFNTKNVTDMGGMFYGCEALAKIDLSTFNTENVTDMGGMFFGCTALTTIYCNDDWNHGVTESGDMFQDNTKLKGAVAYDAAKTGVEMANPTTGYFTKKDNTAISQTSITEDTAARAIYTTDGKQAKRIQAGLNILRMNDGTTRKIVRKQ